MVLVYFSKTGNVKRFIKNLNQPYFKQIEGSSGLKVDTDVVLITYTAGLGQVPDDVINFCKLNSKFIKYVIASGNQNFGEAFALSGNIISKEYGAKLLYKFELSGTKKDMEQIDKSLADLSMVN